ncbi:hypothetical protein EVAR_92547_1 [Eumeta japonica]|uniref:Uncharacterized protein n=1 Tax=Eumeta variegata TaxID=151549 RepID=A0A4C1SZD6_EUMVA|nr:hypothetical protein EVAR_92547_1 [Eumeta japonica]
MNREQRDLTSSTAPAFESRESHSAAPVRTCSNSVIIIRQKQIPMRFTPVQRRTLHSRLRGRLYLPRTSRDRGPPARINGFRQKAHFDN